MTNILVLTNIYPAPDLEKENTPVVHYFTREWVKMGYKVVVVHFPANFPKLVMFFGGLFKKRLSSRMGATIRTTQAIEADYIMEGVKVKRIPILKYRPHTAFSQKQKNLAFDKTVGYLSHIGFYPDVMVSHWVNPEVEIMDRLKEVFHVPTVYVAHTPSAEFDFIYSKEQSQKLIRRMDLVGFRSAYIKEKFCKNFDYNGPTFQCYSGVPERYIPEKPIVRNFKEIRKFVFVGTLIKRKFPAEVLYALKKVYSDADFSISYIGTGSESVQIDRYAYELGVKNSVHQLGYLSRDEVVEQMQSNDVFVMISRAEAFGLVYLEAMAQGLITIASRQEGFDGIIKHGYNGFLCEAGNMDELARLIREIKSMTPEELQQISKNAFETAKSLTDVKAAKLYLKAIEDIVS